MSGSADRSGTASGAASFILGIDAMVARATLTDKASNAHGAARPKIARPVGRVGLCGQDHAIPPRGIRWRVVRCSTQYPSPVYSKGKARMSPVRTFIRHYAEMVA